MNFEENEIEYSHHDSFEQTTTESDKAYVKSKIKEMYPESEGYRVTFIEVPSTGSISLRGDVTLKVEVERDERFKKRGKHF